MRRMNQPSRRVRALVLACHGALVVALPLMSGVFGLVMAVPLLCVAPGLWRGTPRMYAGASLLLIFYAGGGLMEALAHSSRTPGALAVASIAALEFCGMILYVRVRAAEIRRASATAGQTPASADAAP